MLTLFEMTTQHGWIHSVLTSLMHSSKKQTKLFSIEFISIRGQNRRYARVFYTPKSLDEPILTYPIREREAVESVQMWQQAVAKELGDLWKKHFGKRTEATPDSTASPPIASSTDAPPPPEKSPSDPPPADPEPTASAPSNPNNRSANSKAGSSTLSLKTSRKTA